MNRNTIIARLRDFKQELESEASYGGNPYAGLTEGMVDFAKQEKTQDILDMFNSRFEKLLKEGK